MSAFEGVEIDLDLETVIPSAYSRSWLLLFPWGCEFAQTLIIFVVPVHISLYAR